MTDDDVFEGRILGFERCWGSNGPCEIADFLEPPLARTPGRRRRLLVELIGIDLEFRWRGRGPDSKSPGRLGLADYVVRFPELGSLETLTLELIGEEYRVRMRWGDRPTHEEFLSRFRARREPIRSLLIRIDGELDEESADLRPIGMTASGPSRLEADPRGEGEEPRIALRDVKLLRLIGAGRMGKVYRAWQGSAGREVAVKFLRKSLRQHPGLVKRFIGEARTVEGLRHPSIVGTHGLGHAPGGAYFIVMDLVRGPNLQQVAASRRPSFEEVVRWGVETGEAIAHAHDRGIIHCDLKPANLLLDEDGRIRVTDFGLARSLTEDLPWTAEVEGTAPFMAPEQVSRCWGELDRRTDVYGLGAVLFTLLTGRPPWVGRRLSDVLADVVVGVPVVAPSVLRPGIPESLSELCRRCLAKDPADRYPSVRDVVADLNRLARDLRRVASVVSNRSMLSSRPGRQ